MKQSLHMKLDEVKTPSNFIRSEQFVDAILLICPSLVGCLTMFAALEKSGELAGLFGGGIVAIVALAVLRLFRERHRFKRVKQAEEEPSSALDAVLISLHHTLLHGGGTPFKSPDLRICLHAPRGPKEWRQVTDYVGPKVRVGKGSVRNRKVGVVGEAFRTGKHVLAKLPSGKDRIQFLMKYGFEREEAAGVKSDTKSWLAVLVGDTNNPIAVLYCDSVETEFFGRKDHFRQNVLRAAVLGIAQFIPTSPEGAE